MHTPVLLKEAVDRLNIKAGGLYIDATLGEGGHLREIIKKGGKVLALDWDQKQISNFEAKGRADAAKIVCGNYAEIEEIAKRENFYPVDGVLFDLGLSMEQLKTSGKGFSYKRLDEPLDMRLSEEIDTDAGDLLNSLNKEELYEIFAKYSEDLDSRAIADRVVSSRIKSRLNNVKDLVNVIDEALKSCHQKHKHDLNKTLTRIFQALRVSVNGEFENIKSGLRGALNIVKEDGVVVIITFHSLEDRVVKQFIRSNNFKSEEIIKGSKDFVFERSATLRVIKKNMKNTVKIFMAVLMFILIVANITFLLRGMSQSDKINKFEADISKLKEENTDLEKKVYQTQSFSYATSMAAAMSFTKKTNPIYIDNLLYAHN